MLCQKLDIKLISCISSVRLSSELMEKTELNTPPGRISSSGDRSRQRKAGNLDARIWLNSRKFEKQQEIEMGMPWVI